MSFMNISVVKKMVMKVFMLSYTSLSYSLRGYLSKDKVTVLPRINSKTTMEKVMLVLIT